jgi:hypothetical protein
MESEPNFFFLIIYHPYFMVHWCQHFFNGKILPYFDFKGVVPTFKPEKKKFKANLSKG